MRRALTTSLFLATCLVASVAAAPSASAAGLLYADTDAIDFDGRAPGSVSDSEGIFLVNEGPDPVTVDSIELAGDDAAQFEVSYEDCTVAPLEVDEACLIAVAFAPIADGEFQARVAIGSDAANAPHSVELTGRASSERLLGFSPSHVGFGVYPIGDRGSIPVSVTNNGYVPVAISSTTLAGDRTFLLSANNCSATVLQPGSSCSFVVDFTPSRAGEFWGEVVVQSNARGAPHRMVVNGRATGRLLEFDPNFVTFASQIGAGTDKSVRLINNGDTREQIAVSLSNDSAKSFRITQSSCAAELAPGASCTLRLSFIQPALGSFGGSLTARDETGTVLASASLMGSRRQQPPPWNGLASWTLQQLARSQVEGNLRSMLRDALDRWPRRRKRMYARRGFTLPPFRIFHDGELTATIRGGRRLVASAQEGISRARALKVVARTTTTGRRLLTKRRRTRLTLGLRFRVTRGILAGGTVQASAPFVLRR